LNGIEASVSILGTCGVANLYHSACLLVSFAAVVDAVANWDWATVAVFTCQGSCSSSTQHASPAGAAAADAAKQQQCEVFPEAVFVINEQDCHIALPPPVPGVGAGAEPGTKPSSAAAAEAAAAGPADDEEVEDSLQDEEEEN
jgi:hypothetical protein